MKRFISTTTTLLNRAKRPLSLRKKDSIAAPVRRSPGQVASAPHNAVLPQQPAQSLPPQQYQQPGGGGFGSAIIEGFGFGVGSSIARRMVDSVWPGASGPLPSAPQADSSAAGAGVDAGGGAGWGGGQPAPHAPAQPPQSSFGEDDTQYEEDPYDDGGGWDDGED